MALFFAIVAAVLIALNFGAAMRVLGALMLIAAVCLLMIY
jgi:hypothetical protein